MKIMQEHLFIVCELLRANLYEFQKFNQESGGEAYFSLSRLQVCLLAGLVPFGSFCCLFCLDPWSYGISALDPHGPYL
jgi:hypothetical protein